MSHTYIVYGDAPVIAVMVITFETGINTPNYLIIIIQKKKKIVK
jgi:hypothetical protein